MTTLFGGGRPREQSKYLVEFRAGKMSMDAESKLVTPDKRRGSVMVHQTDDGLMHFMWKERNGSSQNPEDDLIIFPDDVEFKKVDQCKTGRVFLLKFKSSGRKMFFWMQEPKADKDEEYCKKVNDYLNNPPAPGSGGRSSGGGGGGGALSALGLGGGSGSGGGGLDLSSVGDAELQSLLNNMSQQQLMQLFGGGGSGLAALLGGGGGGGGSGGGGSSRRQRTAESAAAASSAAAATTSSATSSTATPPAAAGATSGSGSGTQSSGAAPPIQLTDLQSILSGIQVPPGEGGSGGGNASSSGPAVDLSAGLTGEAVEPLLRNRDFVRKMKDLLPAEHKDNDLDEEIKGTISSPQFQQALSMFSSAFQSGQLSPLIREFELGEAAVRAADGGDLDAFVRALQDKDGGEKKKEEDKPEDMALD